MIGSAWVHALFPSIGHPAIVPADHLVHFILGGVDALDLRQAKVNARGTGSEQCPPSMAVLWATIGQHSLAALAALAGRARSTLQIWLEDFTEGGLDRLLEREAGPGQPSPVAKPRVQDGLKAGSWRTAGEGWAGKEKDGTPEPLPEAR